MLINRPSPHGDSHSFPFLASPVTCTKQRVTVSKLPETERT